MHGGNVRIELSLDGRAADRSPAFVYPKGSVIVMIDNTEAQRIEEYKEMATDLARFKEMLRQEREKRSEENHMARDLLGTIEVELANLVREGYLKEEHHKALVEAFNERGHEWKFDHLTRKWRFKFEESVSVTVAREVVVEASTREEAERYLRDEMIGYLDVDNIQVTVPFDSGDDDKIELIGVDEGEIVGDLEVTEID